MHFFIPFGIISLSDRFEERIDEEFISDLNQSISFEG